MSRNSNQIARGRIRRFESCMPSQPVRLHCVTEDGRTKTARYRVVSRWQRGFQKAWISIEWMNGCLNNFTKDAARAALPDTTFGCGNPPSTTAVLPRADLGFTCRRKSLGTDQALRSSGARRLRNQPRKPGVRYSATSSFAQPLSARQNARSPLYIQHHHHPGASPEGFTLA